MSFLSGWTIIALAAGLTVPPLVALYFLKLKRRTQPIPSTLLWKRAVQDLQVNSPFQKLRRNLLLLLQLLVLLLGAFALGKPIVQAPRTHEGTVILMVDHSASMGVEEDGGKTRLDIAKEQAKRIVDNMDDDTRAMVISFADKAAIVSSFDTDRSALKSRIDSIEPTQALSTLGEAIALAEAHASNLVIGSEDDAGGLTAPDVEAPASVLLFTDGRVEDAPNLVSQRFRAESMEVVTVGGRTDNVGIVAMEARRNYESPEQLEVFAEVRNFGEQPVSFDATLVINGEHIRVLESDTPLEPGIVAAEPDAEVDDEDATAGRAAPTTQPKKGPPPRSSASVVFNESYEGGGVVEVRLNVHDALSADNRAWAVVQPPRSSTVLLVTNGNTFLERVLSALPIELTRMSPQEYEDADEADVVVAKRSKYDVVIFDAHSTARLPSGNYFFWGAVPQIEGVQAGDTITNEVIVNWDETHPVLRHIAVESIQVFQWLKLTLPPESVALMTGETSPVLAYLARDGRQYLLCAFGLLAKDPETGEPLLNTFWVTQTHFPVFMYNAIQYLSASLAVRSLEAVRPGEPVILPAPQRGGELKVHRPDGKIDTVATSGSDTVPYARTRHVGVYQVRPGAAGRDTFAVNLFSPSESNVAPNRDFTIGAEAVPAKGGVHTVSKPLWPYLLVAALVLLILEWIIYNKRVFV